MKILPPDFKPRPKCHPERAVSSRALSSAREQARRDLLRCSWGRRNLRALSSRSGRWCRHLGEPQKQQSRFLAPAFALKKTRERLTGLRNDFRLGIDGMHSASSWFSPAFRAVGTWIVFLVIPAFSLPPALPELYGASGVHAQAVRQGSLGSCYFHSAIAAIAATDPDILKHSIETVKQGQWKVRFADGKSENVYLNDVQYTRDSGFDRSEGLWVPILFRAYAQRVMREGLLEAVKASEVPAVIKSTGTSFFSTNDLLLLVYDRAVRATISQEGDVDRKLLTTNLDKEMAAVSISVDTRKLLLHMLDSKGYFDALAAKVKTNGEMFGAYRAIGQGGLPEQVLAAFTGKAEGVNVSPTGQFVAALTRAQKSHLAITASTGASPTPKLLGILPSLAEGKDWYVESHAYTILSFDPDQKKVTLRNPWGDHPDPDGTFTIPLDTFASAYDRIAFSEPGAGR